MWVDESEFLHGSIDGNLFIVVKHHTGVVGERNTSDKPE